MIDDPQAEVEKKLGEVIGPYHEGPTGVLPWLKTRVLVWIIGAGLALAAVATIVLIIESHRLPPEEAKAPPKPVQVQIITK